MSEPLHRKELTYLLEWLERPGRKPLVIRGARQVGKSTLVQQLALASAMPLVALNSEGNPEYKEAFSSNDPANILSTLQLLTGSEVTAGKTLLFLDKIRESSTRLTFWRWLLLSVCVCPLSIIR